MIVLVSCTYIQLIDEWPLASHCLPIGSGVNPTQPSIWRKTMFLDEWYTAIDRTKNNIPQIQPTYAKFYLKMDLNWLRNPLTPCSRTTNTHRAPSAPAFTSTVANCIQITDRSQITDLATSALALPLCSSLCLPWDLPLTVQSCILAKDCKLSEWADWGPCSKACLDPDPESSRGQRSRTRRVHQFSVGEGEDCPPLEETEPCDPQGDGVLPCATWVSLSVMRMCGCMCGSYSFTLNIW